MAFVRTSIRDFSLANNAYIGASVSFFIPDANGQPTAAFATLYDDLTGVGTLPNPQTLDSEGKFQQPVYIDEAVVASVTLGLQTFVTGVIRPALSSGDVTRAIQAENNAIHSAAQATQSARRAKRSADQLSLSRQVLPVQVFS